MKTQQYEAPDSVDKAVALLASAKGQARVLAGGTDLLIQLRVGRIAADLIVDIKHIAGMRDIVREADGGFRIGAAVSGAEADEHAELVAAWPGVVEGWELIGSTQIQGRATIAGNLCNASPAADGVPALVAAGAQVSVAGPNGTRKVPVEAIAIGPGRNSLAKGEFVVAIHLPKRPARSSDAYLRLIPRTEMDIAVVGCAVNLTLDAAGTCIDAAVTLGAVAPTVLRVPDAAKALIGTKLDSAALAKLAAAASAACKPIDDKRGTVVYRTKIAGVLARRAALIAYERAQKRA